MRPLAGYGAAALGLIRETRSRRAMETRLKDPEHRREVEESVKRQENRLVEIEELREANRFLVKKVRGLEAEIDHLTWWPPHAPRSVVLDD